MISSSHSIESPQPIEQIQETGRQQWGRKEFGYVLAGTFLIWLVLDRSAAWLGSLRGEAGLWVCALVIVTTLLVERVLFKTSIQPDGRMSQAAAPADLPPSGGVPATGWPHVLLGLALTSLGLLRRRTISLRKGE
jgi:hypothetical protein